VVIKILTEYFMEKINNVKATNENGHKSKIMMSALDPFIQSNIVLPTETKKRGSDMIMWGEDNKYPLYL
jgi:hypothetical protein